MLDLMSIRTKSKHLSIENTGEVTKGAQRARRGKYVRIMVKVWAMAKRRKSSRRSSETK